VTLSVSVTVSGDISVSVSDVSDGVNDTVTNFQMRE
jgi:hypothetical protein